MQVEAAKALMAHGAEVDDITNDGRTPLMLACKANQVCRQRRCSIQMRQRAALILMSGTHAAQGKRESLRMSLPSATVSSAVEADFGAGERHVWGPGLFLSPKVTAPLWRRSCEAGQVHPSTQQPVFRTPQW